MSSSKTKNLTIIIFPYLFIHDKDGIEVDDLVIKPSYKENVDKESESVKTELTNVAKFFRHGKNWQITHWSYTIVYLRSKNDRNKVNQALYKFVTVLRFSELRDLRDQAKFAHFNFFVFEIPRLNAGKEFSHYEGILNGESYFSFYVRKSEVENHFAPSQRIDPLILSREHIQNGKYVQFMYSKVLKDKDESKILRAMEWFNRSFSHDGRGVDWSEAILNLHTALEALLRPQEEERGIKAQIKTALLNILGHSDELLHWIDNFWKLRNSIVHGDIEKPQFMYVHPLSKMKKGHRHHITLARQVFVKCVHGILKMRSEFPLIGFEDELISPHDVELWVTDQGWN